VWVGVLGGRGVPCAAPPVLLASAAAAAAAAVPPVLSELSGGTPCVCVTKSTGPGSCVFMQST
jgi:hypothetical protein